jgi:hypothetical protein
MQYRNYSYAVSSCSRELRFPQDMTETGREFCRPGVLLPQSTGRTRADGRTALGRGRWSCATGDLLRVRLTECALCLNDCASDSCFSVSQCASKLVVLYCASATFRLRAATLTLCMRDPAFALAHSVGPAAGWKNTTTMFSVIDHQLQAPTAAKLGRTWVNRIACRLGSCCGGTFGWSECAACSLSTGKMLSTKRPISHAVVQHCSVRLKHPRVTSTLSPRSTPHVRTHTKGEIDVRISIP